MSGFSEAAALRQRAGSARPCRHNRARTGTPGWVVWCPHFVYPPTTDWGQAVAWFELAESFGCTSMHLIRDVLIASNGINFRYVEAREEAS